MTIFQSLLYNRQIRANNSYQSMNIADLTLSHRFINYLGASYHGRFAALNILAQLNSKEFSQGELERVQSCMDMVSVWAANLVNGVPLFSADWSTAESPEATEAMNLLQETKADLLRLVSKLNGFLVIKDLVPFPEAVKFLIAAFGRYAYSHDSYVRGFVDFGNAFNQPELVQEYSPLAAEITEELQWVDTFVTGFQGSERKPSSFYEGLLQEVVLLPGVFRTHIHDVNQLLATYLGEFSFELADIGEQEAQIWRKHNIAAAEAGYWRSYGVAAEETARWKNAGVSFYRAAVDWRRFGFSPESAGPWFQRGFPVAVARLWSEAGYDADFSLSQIQKGVADPSKVILEEESGET